MEMLIKDGTTLKINNEYYKAVKILPTETSGKQNVLFYGNDWFELVYVRKNESGTDRR